MHPRADEKRECRVVSSRAGEAAAPGPRLSIHVRRVDIAAGLGLIALVALTYGDLLAPGTRTIVSHPLGDLARYFLPARAFGFGELAGGNLPWWNPYLFAGTPFIGGWQSAMFYPPNLIHLVLPLPLALNFEVVLHTALMALFTYGWGRQRGLQPVGAFLAGTVAISGGTWIGRVLAGQLTVLAVLAWTPLFFCALERVVIRPGLGWVLVGTFALAMQVLAGYPGGVLMAVFAGAILCAAQFVSTWRHGSVPGAAEELRVSDGGVAFTRGGLAPRLVALVAIGGGAVLLSAAQLWTGIVAARESLRGAGVSYDWAATYSLPPENLFTAIVPGLLGDVLTVPYWGRTFFWDANLFVGVVVLAFAVLGATAPGQARARRGLLALLVVMLVLTLGRHTPAHRLLFDWIPGFAQLRAPSKFAPFAALAVALLAGLGVDRVRASPGGAWPAVPALGLVVLALGAAAVGIATMARGSAWSDLVRGVQESREVAYWLSDHDVARAALFARDGLLVACAVAGLAAVLFALVPRWRGAVALLIALALVELLVFARGHRGEFSIDDRARAEADAWFARVDPAQRTLDAGGGLERGRNRGLELRRPVVWGYDPFIQERYARFMLRAMGLDLPVWSMSHLVPAGDYPLLRLLRVAAVIRPGANDALELPAGKSMFRLPGRRQNDLGEAPEVVEPARTAPLPRFFFVVNWRIEATPEGVLDRLTDPGWDPMRLALLDRPPGDLEPTAGGPVQGKVDVLSESTDEIVLDVSVDADALLVVTDAWSEGWHAEPVAPADPRQYQVIPVDHVLRGLPVVAGRHRIRLEYAPRGSRVAVAISSATAGVYLLAVFVSGRRWLKRSRRGGTAT